jgi:signal transduction histidine kinase
MAKRGWLGSTSFRTGAVYAAFFLAAVFAIFTATYLSIRGDMRGTLQSSTREDVAQLLTEYKSKGLSALKEAVEERLAETQGFDRIYSLTGADGALIAGNTATAPPVEGPFDGGVLPLPGKSASDDPLNAALGEARKFAGITLFAGRNAEPMQETLDLLLTSFTVGALTTATAALLLGMLLGLYSTRRVEAMSATTRSVISSGIKDRLTLSGSGDEFDRLSGDINVMLDRIEDLMEGMRQISSDIAHELRTPLSRLRHNLEGVMSQRPASLAAYKTTVAKSISETDAIIETFNALLRIAQIEGGARRSNFRRLSLSELLESLAEIYGPVAEDAGLKLSAYIALSLDVTGDRDLLMQAFANLIENAIRYVPEGGQIWLSLKQPGGRARVAVSDNGPGIPQSERKKVFQRLYRLEQSRTNSGSGLGLALVSAVAALHHIEVSLSDNQPGLKVALDFPQMSAIDMQA